MATTLTGLTLIGSVSGTISDVQSISLGGLEINVINFAQNDDTNAVTNNVPGTVTEGPMTATVTYLKTLQTALRAKALLRTTETWTVTDGGSSTWAGAGFISTVSGIDSDPDSEDTFTLTITPSTKWTFTA